MQLEEFYEYIKLLEDYYKKKAEASDPKNKNNPIPERQKGIGEVVPKQGLQNMGIR